MNQGSQPSVEQTPPVELFANIVTETRAISLPPVPAVNRVPETTVLCASPDQAFLEVFEHAADPDQPRELLDLLLGRIGAESNTSAYAAQAHIWRASRKRRTVEPEEILQSRATVDLVKALFNWYFRDDLYASPLPADEVNLSRGSADEVYFCMPDVLKECLRYALDRDWYGYADSCGRSSAREAIARLENTRHRGASYTKENVAITLGGTSAISSIVDLLSLTSTQDSEPALCAIPNYPPLVAAVARRFPTRLVPLECTNGATSLTPLIHAVTPRTPLILLQTITNPTGTSVSEADLARLVAAGGARTMIVIDECHECVGAELPGCGARIASNVIRIRSLSKDLSVPGLKVGWLVADAPIISEFYEYASTSYGGPPSFFFLLIEVAARMERWLLEGRSSLSMSELGEFEPHYGLQLQSLQTAYGSYRSARDRRNRLLLWTRDAAVTLAQSIGCEVIYPTHSINFAGRFSQYVDGYAAFRDLQDRAHVAVFPGLLTFTLRGGWIRFTVAQPWQNIEHALQRIGGVLESERGVRL